MTFDYNCDVIFMLKIERSSITFDYDSDVIFILKIERREIHGIGNLQQSNGNSKK